jgi:hypothetical protein
MTTHTVFLKSISSEYRRPFGPTPGFGPLVKTTEMEMTVPGEKQIQCRDDDGDELISHFTLYLWLICRTARETFNAEVIFDHWIEGSCAYLRFFLPRDHPRFSDLKTEAEKALSGLQLDVIEICSYSGVPGVMAFMDAQREVMEAAKEHNHPDLDRVAEIALDEGRRAAQRVSAALRGSS